MSKIIPNYALYGDEEEPGWQNSFFFELIPQRARPYNFAIRPHTHGALVQILYLTRGTVEAVVDQTKATIEAPSVLLIPAKTVHGWRFTPDVDGPIVTAAQLPLESLANVLMPPLLQTLRTPSILHLSQDNGSDELMQTYLAIEREARRRSLGYVAAGMSLLIALVVQIARLQQTVPATPLRAASRRAEQLEKFKALVEEHFKEHWTMRDYASELGITPGQLTRMCREALGKPSIAVVHARLANEAQRDLVYTANSVRQLADRLGFDDEAYFSRFFRKQTGFTPREFRKLAMQDVMNTASERAG
ncbi:MAG: helix-turn-helix domain-containing protein [Burkholderiales bacterium]